MDCSEKQGGPWGDDLERGASWTPAHSHIQSKRFTVGQNLRVIWRIKGQLSSLPVPLHPQQGSVSHAASAPHSTLPSVSCLPLPIQPAPLAITVHLVNIQQITHASVPSFIPKYLPSTSYVPGAVPSDRNTVATKTHTAPALPELPF